MFSNIIVQQLNYVEKMKTTTAALCLIIPPVLLNATSKETNKERSDSPNVVIIYVDDMGWKDLGCYGSTFYETPNIDSLARKGVRFTDAYSAGIVSSPSRNALLTGKYPARTHFTNISMTPLKGKKLNDPVQNPFLELSNVTFPKIFQAAGYYTGFIGKWHMGIRDNEALKRGEYGFDFHDETPTEGGDTRPRIISREEDPKEIREITDKSIAFVESAVKQNKPFLLYMAHHTVHVELQTTQELQSKYAKKTQGENGQNNPYMGGMIEDLDMETGRFLNKLKELKVENNTLIIFTSDNGGLSKQLGVLVTSQAPLRGGKGDAYEGGTRVPLIISGPEILENKVSSVPTMQIDLYRTLLDFAGLQENPSNVNDGVSLLPILTGMSEGKEAVFQREALYWHYPHYKAITFPYSSIRKRDYKLIVYHEQELSPYGGKATELFNLKDDIGEKNNLANLLTEKRDELYQDLCNYRIEMNAQMPEINPDYKKSSDSQVTTNLISVKTADVANFTNTHKQWRFEMLTFRMYNTVAGKYLTAHADGTVSLQAKDETATAANQYWALTDSPQSSMYFKNIGTAASPTDYIRNLGFTPIAGVDNGTGTTTLSMQIRKINGNGESFMILNNGRNLSPTPGVSYTLNTTSTYTRSIVANAGNTSIVAIDNSNTTAYPQWQFEEVNSVASYPEMTYPKRIYNTVAQKYLSAQAADLSVILSDRAQSRYQYWETYPSTANGVIIIRNAEKQRALNQSADNEDLVPAGTKEVHLHPIATAQIGNNYLQLDDNTVKIPVQGTDYSIQSISWYSRSIIFNEALTTVYQPASLLKTKCIYDGNNIIIREINEPTTISLFNMLGNMLSTFHVTNDISIPIDYKGVLFVRVKSLNSNTTFKVRVF